MTKIYKTAGGKTVDMDALLAKNEHVIAVGNRKVNAGGDLLGPGGKVVKTRDQIMREYYNLNTPVAADPVAAPQTVPQASVPASPRADFVPAPAAKPAPLVQPAPVVAPEPVVINPESGMDEEVEVPAPVVAAPVVETAPTVEPVTEQTSPVTPPMRGSLASAVAKEVTVTQTAKLPPKKANGIQRF